MTFEELHGPLVLFGGLARFESSEVPPLAGLRIFFTRIKPVFSGTKFSDHTFSLLQRTYRPAQYSAEVMTVTTSKSVRSLQAASQGRSASSSGASIS
jgi:hypothetical protein